MATKADALRYDSVFVTDHVVLPASMARSVYPYAPTGQLAGGAALPKPAQKAGIPIWIGGHTDAALKRAGTLGDSWHPIGLRPPALLYPDEYAAKAKQVHAWAQRAGRDPKAVTLTFRCPMEVRSK